MVAVAFTIAAESYIWKQCIPNGYGQTDMLPLTWATHPNPVMREKLAVYLGSGYRINALSVDSAELVRPKRSARLAWLVINPLYLFSLGRKREDRIHLTVGADGIVHEART
jgi:hypothetical protein